MNLPKTKNSVGTLIALSVLGLAFTSFPGNAYAFHDVQTKARRPYQKAIRTRMPPSVFHEWVQKEFNAVGPEWQTAWQTFVVEDEPDADEYLVIIRSQDKKWAFGVEKEDCEKPENFEDLKAQVKEGGTPIHVDCIVGIKKRRSFFRYQINVFEPMYPFWKSPCYVWSLPPGSREDPFYSKNYNMAVYAGHLKEKIYELVSTDASQWRPPKKVKKIPAIKGPGQELIGGDSEILTDEEKKLSITEQEKILKQRKKEQEKEERAKKKKK